MTARVIDLASRRADAEVVPEDYFVAAFDEYQHREDSLALVHSSDEPTRVALIVGGDEDRRVARGLVMDAATARTLGFALISIAGRARRDAEARERAERSDGDGTGT